MSHRFNTPTLALSGNASKGPSTPSSAPACVRRHAKFNAMFPASRLQTARTKLRRLICRVVDEDQQNGLGARTFKPTMHAVIDLDELAVAIANDDAAAERASFARGRVFICLQQSSSFERSPKPPPHEALPALVRQRRSRVGVLFAHQGHRVIPPLLWQPIGAWPAGIGTAALASIIPKGALLCREM